MKVNSITASLSSREIDKHINNHTEVAQLCTQFSISVLSISYCEEKVSEGGEKVSRSSM